MNEQQLKQRLASLVEDAPARTSSSDDLRRGRRRVALRRGATVAASGFAAVAVVAAVAAVSGSERPTGQPATVLDDAQVLQRCTEVEGGLDPALFGPGSRVVTAEMATDGDLGAVVMAPGGAYWARCWVFDGPESDITPAVTTFPMAADQSFSETGDFEVNGGFRYVDRFPADVARVDAHLSDGRTLSAEAVDGFVAFQRRIEGIGDVTLDSVTLYGADGSVLADKSMAPGDGTLPAAYRTLMPVQGVAPIVARCTQVDNGALDPEVFGVGSRVLTSETGSDGDVRAVVFSADRQFWAECWLSGDPGSEFNGYASTYPMQPAESGEAGETHGMTYGNGSLSYVDRFRPVVARVEIAFRDGPTFVADTVDGFVVMQRELPGYGPDRGLPRADYTLYDAQGDVLTDTSEAEGDATLLPEWRTLVPAEPVDPTP